MAPWSSNKQLLLWKIPNVSNQGLPHLSYQFLIKRTQQKIQGQTIDKTVAKPAGVVKKPRGNHNLKRMVQCLYVDVEEKKNNILVLGKDFFL